MAAKNDILRDKDGNQIFPATIAEQVSYDGKINVKQAIKRGAVRNKVAPTVASMTDKEQIYVYTGTEEGYTFGNWYYWDGTAWTSGGAYNAIEVNTDGTLTEEGAPADAKATGDKLSELKDDIEQLKQGGTSSTGGGMNATAQSLLISILQNAVYESEQSAIILALKTALAEGGTSSGGESGGDSGDSGETKYTVTSTCTYCTLEPSETSIAENGVYIGTITADEGYNLSSVVVTMGGKDITSSVYSKGSISISKVTGNIVIVAIAEETSNDLVYTANWTYGKRQYNVTGVQDNASWTSSDWIDVTAGQKLTATLLETSDIDGVTYTWNTANMSFGPLFKDASGNAVTATIESGYMSLRDNYPSSQEVIIPDGAVSMCLCMASKRVSYSKSSYDGIIVSCENIEGRPVWWSLVLSSGGDE